MSRLVKMLGKKSVDDTLVWEEYINTSILLYNNLVLNQSQFRRQYNTNHLVRIIIQTCKYFIKLSETQIRRKSCVTPATFKKVGKTFTLLYIEALWTIAYDKLNKGSLEGFGASIYKAINCLLSLT